MRQMSLDPGYGGEKKSWPYAKVLIIVCAIVAIGSIGIYMHQGHVQGQGQVQAQGQAQVQGHGQGDHSDSISSADAQEPLPPGAFFVVNSEQEDEDQSNVAGHGDESEEEKEDQENGESDDDEFAEEVTSEEEANEDEAVDDESIVTNLITEADSQALELSSDILELPSDTLELSSAILELPSDNLEFLSSDTTLECIMVCSFQEEPETEHNSDGVIEIEQDDETSNDDPIVIVPTGTLSIYLNEELFHRILQYVANSPQLMCMTSKWVCGFVNYAGKYRFYGGLGWDMPELANVWQFGAIGMEDSEALAAERKLITDLRYIRDGQSFYDCMVDYLVTYGEFKELAVPVFKYLARILMAALRKGISCDRNGSKRKRLLLYAAENGFFEFIFEIRKDRLLRHNAFDDDEFFYLDYFNWVYDDPVALDFMLKSSSTSNMYMYDIEPWAGVCIQRKAPKSYYLESLDSNVRFPFVIAIYLSRTSLIDLDAGEMEYYHTFIRSLLDERLSQLDDGQRAHDPEFLLFTNLLNDVRYGPPEDPENYLSRLQNLARVNSMQLAMAASKANKKELAQILSNRRHFDINLVEFYYNDPHSFKIFFDVLEGTPSQNPHNGAVNYASVKLLDLINGNRFTITASAPFLAGYFKFTIESPAEFVELGFASAYEFIVKTAAAASDVNWLFVLKRKMFRDAADAGAQEFANFINRNCGTHVTVSNALIAAAADGIIAVSYEAIRMLLEDEALIRLLQDREIKVSCRDSRITDRSIASYRQVINPRQN